MSTCDGMSDGEKKKMLELIESSWARMDREPEVHEWQPPGDFLNPGSFSPQAQNLHAMPTVDQTRTVARLPGGRVESNGEVQFANKRPRDMGVRSVPGHRQMLGSYNGEFHSRNLEPLDQGVTSTSVGTPPAQHVDVASQNLHVAPLARAAGSPPAVNVNSSAGRPGSGVPTNVNIR